MTKFQLIDKCRICNSSSITKFMDLKDQPPANSLRLDLKEDLMNIPLQLLYCKKCSTVQLSATVAPEYLFSHYVWVTGTSSTARAYSSYFADNVLKRSFLKKPFIVEVASNDGTFLKEFKSNGCKVLGVDPAKNIADLANKSGIPTVSKFFNLETAKEIGQEHGKGDIIIARNVIPHVKEVHSIISGIQWLLRDEGIGVIEFHYSQIILNELHYDSIYHEHLFFYSLKSISHLLKLYDLYPFDLTESPISGGSLVIYFSKNPKEESKKLKEAINLENEKKTNELQTWINFAYSCNKHAETLKSIITEYKAKGPILAYGASARSSTLLNFAGLDSSVIDFIIDKNPLKHNRYSPGTNIKIISFEEGITHFENYSSILLLAWNFEKEIISDLRKNGFKGPIIVPLPNQVRIL